MTAPWGDSQRSRCRSDDRRAGRTRGRSRPGSTHPAAAGTRLETLGKRTKPMTREQALRALTEDGIMACPYCRPDRELGVL
ncbi:DUF6233 domain-containing protein [Streptomyces sp. NPDC005077]|uniref:DUF6233 domain-containing protein n=1 Tax=Streptomyces sp. NPDC005077 TaxID=3154292 RepID=UPI0033A45BAA